jgi:hypothetical protein
MVTSSDVEYEQEVKVCELMDTSSFNFIYNNVLT